MILGSEVISAAMADRYRATNEFKIIDEFIESNKTWLITYMKYKNQRDIIVENIRSINVFCNIMIFTRFFFSFLNKPFP